MWDVDYEVSGGDATGTGTDYTLANGTLNFLTGDTPPADSLQTFDITITTADTNVELDETIEITLRNAVFGAVGADSVLTVTIQDDDNDGFSGPGGVGDNTNNALWLQAFKYNLSDGATITTDWLDQSGNDYDLAVNGNPTYQVSGINGQPSLDLDGAGDYFLDSDGNYMNGSTGMAMFAIVQSDNAATDRGFFDTEVPNGTDNILGLRYDVDGGEGDVNLIKVGLDTDAGNTAMETATSTQTTNPQLITYYWSGSNPNIRLDGTTDTPSEAGASIGGAIENSNLVYVGVGPKDETLATDGWDGDLGEFILYNQSLNNTQLNLVENYLGARFQVTGLGNDIFRASDSKW